MEIGKINSLTSDWLYHEQEIRRGSDKSYHEGQQKKDEKLLFEIMLNLENLIKKNRIIMTANKFLLKLRDAIFMLNSGDIPLFINGSQVGDVKCSVEGEGTTIHIDMSVEPETIKKGDKFLCIQTVVMEDTGEIAYIEGKEYASEMDSCITDEQRCDNHFWSEEDSVWNYFMKLNN